MQLPITYYGGKGMMYKEIIKYLPPVSSYSIYVEPYGGSASIMFKKEPSPVEIYNDIFYEVYCFFHVLQNPQLQTQLIERIQSALFHEEVSNQFLQELKEFRKTGYGTESMIDIAFKFWFINRTRRGGGQGGLKVNTVIRRSMSKSTSDFQSAAAGLEQFADRIRRCIFLNRDALDLISQWDRLDVVMYLDPPYVPDTRTSASYVKDVDIAHYEKLIDILANIEYARILISGYDHEVYNPLIETGYWHQVKFDVNTVSGTNESKKKTECLWANYYIDSES